MTFASPETIARPTSDLQRRQPLRCARRVAVDNSRTVAAYQGVPRAKSVAPFGFQALGSERDEADEADSKLIKPTFVRCTCQELAEGELDWLDPESTVLEIEELAEPAPDVSPFDLMVLKAARAKGYRLAFDSRLLGKAYAPFVPLASFVVLDMGVMELDSAAAVARAVHSRTKATPFATQVTTAAEFGCLASAGVKLYEGLWFAQPPATPDRSVRVGYASLINLMNMVMREAEIHEIEDLLKREPTLSFKLLRYINSAGFGRKVEIESFRHAVMTVGMKRLFRWTALLIAGTPAGNIAPAVGTLAIVRGRTMELLAQETLSPAETDLAFVTGMFSMLDMLLNTPIEEALGLVNLPLSVTDAILHNEGSFAPFLAIAKACEAGDEAPLDGLALRHELALPRILEAHSEALGWAEQFGH